MNVRVLDDKTLAASFDETHLEDRSCFELVIHSTVYSPPRRSETCQYHHRRRRRHHRQYPSNYINTA